ncbi:uncharacterized protein KY384_000660 [Bacidia gigantensis]|uniref:uncharacterized protein n=1 Tax=Bacidia gigantensis TaxID=2732470 RepID=UPI001D055F88|nr:uncharacterized protein KY384_000660 [Bacidia gigantensis]KAG8525898.1 hypothetical protein KY384_000660 [Bacidia gigantensis]
MELAIITGSTDLAIRCTKIVQRIHVTREKFKAADLTVKSLVDQVESLRYAWTKISDWSGARDVANDCSDCDWQFQDQLEKKLDCGYLVIAALEEDLMQMTANERKSRMTFKQKTAFVWNESIIEIHRKRVSDQVQSMGLLLQVSQLPTPKERVVFIVNSRTQLKKSDESAYSIIPSRRSMSIQRESSLSTDSEALAYYPFDFEDDLFTSDVYKRNYRTAKEVSRGSQVKSSQDPQVKTSILRADGQGENVEKPRISSPVLISSSRLGIPSDFEVPWRIRGDSTHRPTEWYRTFFEALNNQSSIQEIKASTSGALGILWEALPEDKMKALGDDTVSSNDIQIGRIFTQGDIKRAESLFSDYYDAWAEIAILSIQHPIAVLLKVRSLSRQMKICLILKLLGHKALLDLFCRNKIDDSALPLSVSDLEEVFKDQEDFASLALLFQSQQYNIVQSE